MGEKTAIAWCSHTFNPWWGCYKVSPGCENCYAEKLAGRFGYGNMWFESKRRFFGDKYWNKPIAWDNKAFNSGTRKSVFCGSMCDIFDDPTGDYETAIWLNGERERLWKLILDTPNLDWLLLTKRPENIQGLMYHKWLNPENIPNNIRIGITCENKAMADKRMKTFLDSWQGKNFVSIEPMLSRIKLKQDWIDYLDGWCTETEVDQHGDPCPAQAPMNKINWVICGCESGPNARPCDIDWVRDLRDQCVVAGTPFFLKQLNIGRKLIREPFLDGRQWLQFPEGEK